MQPPNLSNVTELQWVQRGNTRIPEFLPAPGTLQIGPGPDPHPVTAVAGKYATYIVAIG